MAAHLRHKRARHSSIFRLWVLWSAVWLMGWTIYLTLYGLQDGFRGTGDLIATVIVMFCPPIALLLIGKMARWALRGFTVE